MSNLGRNAKFISSNILGRKRAVVENIIDEREDDDYIEPIMKELETETTTDREQTLHDCMELFNSKDKKDATLNRDFLKMYLNLAFSSKLPPQLTPLDASQPWMLYWISNSLKALNPEWLTDDFKRSLAQKLFKLVESDNSCGGPFGGGVGQLPHMAGSFAAINSLVVCDNIDGCWDKVDRKAIYKWLMELKQPDGGFKTCLEVGETDTRGVYCALEVASLLNLMTVELTEGVVEYLVKCQTYEGGFGGCSHEDEAHGGYTFCAVASLAILDKLDEINMEKLMEWCSMRQYNEERGLCGRSNKLVDGCYSYWVGATAAILEAAGYGNCINKKYLREYILYCCQSEKEPGLRDKPGKHPDFYHTMYNLYGLAITESKFYTPSGNFAENVTSTPVDASLLPSAPSGICPMNPVYGLPTKDAKAFFNHFR
ncbi:hypothetical protein NCAS_0B05820 [Naumovozyma castellii]|uniref:Protein farnesyltransferase subunit beta n=1 Tax=Naumovozyma castellii TaxID=27288 RepID=G0V9P9_NAUCA|nr:hypothetical protein NCAS_0B05820 [Naumovozyma castellii CBS 4309]CCC68666.1 hypothetical protein NCAS_0B05820 [Naumovozyma castellii CBS 4309]